MIIIIISRFAKGKQAATAQPHPILDSPNTELKCAECAEYMIIMILLGIAFVKISLALSLLTRVQSNCSLNVAPEHHCGY